MEEQGRYLNILTLQIYPVLSTKERFNIQFNMFDLAEALVGLLTGAMDTAQQSDAILTQVR